MKNNIYFLTWSATNSDMTGLACSKNVAKLASEFVSEIMDTGIIPFDFEIRRTFFISNRLETVLDDKLPNVAMVDYQPNNFAWPIMSARMKKLIESEISDKEDLCWIKTNILFNRTSFEYFVLGFGKSFDVLDESKTLYINKEKGHIIKPHFSLKKIYELGVNIFLKPFTKEYERISPGVYITENVRKKLIKEKVTGVKFEKVSAS